MAAAKGNKYGFGNHNAGRPPVYDNADDLTVKITEYFTWCEGEYEMQTQKREKRKKNPETGKMETKTEDAEVNVCLRQPERPTVTGLALFLGFESRQSLKDYSKKQAFSYSIKKALTVIENEYELMLPDAKGSGVIFALKNFGWEDKSTVDSNVNLKGKPDWLGIEASKKAGEAQP